MNEERIKDLAYLLYIHQTDAEDVHMEEFEIIKDNQKYLTLLQGYYKEYEQTYGVRVLD